MTIPSKRIAYWLVEQQVIDENECALYEYAAHTFFLSLFPLGVLLFYSIITSSVFRLVFITAPLFSLRRYGGGYHAPYYWQCFLLSCGIIIAAIYGCGNILLPSPFLLCCLVFSIVVIIRHSPIEHFNRPLSTSQKREYHKRACFICIIWFIATLITHIANLDRCAQCITIGISLCAISQLAAVIKDRFWKKA